MGEENPQLQQTAQLENKNTGVSGSITPANNVIPNLNTGNDMQENNNKNSNVKLSGTISLYVGDLHPDISETAIYEKFSQIGSVLSIRVCRDMITRKSLGYAYVNFQNHKDAETAIEALSFEPLLGQPMRIMWSQRDPTIRKSGVGNIFIKNLDKAITAKELNDTFQLFGKILSAKISTDENGTSRGYGFVHFESEEAANKAMDSLNGKIVKGKTLYVGKFIPRSERGGKPNEKKFTNCYIKNFGENFKEVQIRGLFEPFGEIVSAKVMEDEGGKSKGFGFVCFKEPESALAAVEAMNGKEIDNRIIYVGPAQKKSEREIDLKNKFDAKLSRPDRFNSGVNLYVKNLDEHIDDEQLKREFDQYGHITSAKVMTNSSGRSRGFGFVCFTSSDEASRAVADLNGRIIGSKPLYVAVAQKKEERQAQLAHQQTNRLYNCYGAPPLSFAPPLGAMAPNNLIRQQFGSAFPTASVFPPQINQFRTAAARWNLNAQSAAQMRMSRAPNLIPSGATNAGQNTMLRAPNIASRPILGLQYNNSINMAAAAAQTPTPGLRGAGGAQNITQQGLYRNENIHNHHMQQQMARGNDALLPGLINNGSTNGVPGNSLYENQAALNNPTSGPQEIKKQMLGDMIYPFISEMYPAQAGKITGMLLELDENELKQLQSDADALKRKVREANALIEQKRRLNDCPGNYIPNSGVAAGDLL